METEASNKEEEFKGAEKLSSEKLKELLKILNNRNPPQEANDLEIYRQKKYMARKRVRKFYGEGKERNRVVNTSFEGPDEEDGLLRLDDGGYLEFVFDDRHDVFLFLEEKEAEEQIRRFIEKAKQKVVSLENKIEKAEESLRIS